MSRTVGRMQRGCAAATTLALVLAWSQAAMADESTATGKGTVGGALLGGELVMTIEGIAGVKRPLWYAVGGVLGAVAGGVGGHFIEDGSSKEVSLGLLAAGFAFVIPTSVWVLDRTSYDAPAEYQEDAAPAGTQPAADPPRPSTMPTPAGVQPTSSLSVGSKYSFPAAPRQRRLTLVFHGELPSAAALPPTSMVDLNSVGDLRLGVPAVQVRPTYSRTEMVQFGVTQREEVRVPVFHASF